MKRGLILLLLLLLAAVAAKLSFPEFSSCIGGTELLEKAVMVLGQELLG